MTGEGGIERGADDCRVADLERITRVLVGKKVRARKGNIVGEICGIVVDTVIRL